MCGDGMEAGKLKAYKHSVCFSKQSLSDFEQKKLTYKKIIGSIAAIWVENFAKQGECIQWLPQF